MPEGPNVRKYATQPEFIIRKFERTKLEIHWFGHLFAFGPSVMMLAPKIIVYESGA